MGARFGYTPCWEESEEDWDSFEHEIVQALQSGACLSPCSLGQANPPRDWNFRAGLSSPIYKSAYEVVERLLEASFPVRKKKQRQPKPPRVRQQPSTVEIPDEEISITMDEIEREALSLTEEARSYTRTKRLNLGYVEVCPNVYCLRGELIAECIPL